MEILFYGALILAQLGTTLKEYSMKNCSRLAPGPFNSVFINLCRSTICLVVSFLIWIIADGVNVTTNGMGYLYIILGGLGTALQLFTWILAAKIVSLSFINITSMIGSMLLPMILGPYIYNEAPVSVYAWVGSALLFVSMFFFMNFKGEKKDSKLISKILIVTGCAVGATLPAIFKKLYNLQYPKTENFYNFICFVTMFIAFAALFLVYYLLEKKKLKKQALTKEQEFNGIQPFEATAKKVEIPFKKIWYLILIAAVALYMNEFGTNYAMAGLGAIYYPVARGLTMVCTFLLDVLYFKDKVNAKKLIGLGVVIVSIVLIYMDKIIALF